MKNNEYSLPKKKKKDNWNPLKQSYDVLTFGCVTHIVGLQVSCFLSSVDHIGLKVVLNRIPMSDTLLQYISYPLWGHTWYAIVIPKYALNKWNHSLLSVSLTFFCEESLCSLSDTSLVSSGEQKEMFQQVPEAPGFLLADDSVCWLASESFAEVPWQTAQEENHLCCWKDHPLTHRSWQSFLQGVQEVCLSPFHTLVDPRSEKK